MAVCTYTHNVYDCMWMKRTLFSPSACVCTCLCANVCAWGLPEGILPVLTSPVLIYYSNCASSTLIRNGIAVTSISNSLLNCRHRDNQWTVDSETPGTDSTTHLQEMKHLISFSSYDQVHFSATFMDKSDTEIAIARVFHHVRRLGLISTCIRPRWSRSNRIY